MRTSRSTARRCARVLAAVALVSVTTACGPAGFGSVSTDAGASAPGAAGAAGAGEQAPVDAPAVAPEEPTAVEPSAVPPGDVPPPSAPAPPVAEPAESAATDTTEESAEVPVEPETPVVEAQDRSHGPAAQPAGPAPSTPSGNQPVAAGTAPASSATTGGTGGSFTDQARTRFTASNGRTGQYLRYAGGVSPTKPVGLVVYADGTGEYGVDNPTSPYALGGPSGLVAVAKSRNMITLAVESPDQSCECWHTGDTAGNADFLADLVETQLRSYPVTEVWLVGFSSGAQEITRFLVPRHPELMRVGGGWVVFGGGGPPAGSGAAVTADRMADVRGHWYTGTADTAVPLTASWGAAAGEKWYGARGVRTSHDWASGVGHGLDGRLGRTVAQLLDES